MRFHDPEIVRLVAAAEQARERFGFAIGDAVQNTKNPAWRGVVNTYDETQDDLHITDQDGEDFWSNKQGWKRIPPADATAALAAVKAARDRRSVQYEHGSQPIYTWAEYELEATR